MYIGALPIGFAQAQIVKGDLAKIGLDVEIKTFAFPHPYVEKVLTPGEPYDIAWWGWGADYNDPAAFIDELLDGRQIGRPTNTNASYFNSAKYNRLIERASRLTGGARYRAYARLDRQLARNAAPMVAFAVANSVTMVSSRLDPRCKILNPDLDLAAVCLKR